MTKREDNTCAPMEISDEDVLKAMGAMQGYIDITPADFRQVYYSAYALAVKRMRHAIKAGDMMTRPVQFIHPADSLAEAAQLLADKGISGAPVVDHDEKVVGVVSEKDFLAMMGADPAGSFMAVVARCLKNKGCLAAPMRELQVGEIMSSPAITIHEDISIADISAILMANDINRLPVVGQDDRLKGIVTRSDLVQSYCLL